MSLAACLQELDPEGSWPLALRQVFKAIFWAAEALGTDQLSAAAQQLCRLLGRCEQEATASQMVLEIRCNVSHGGRVNQPAATFHVACNLLRQDVDPVMQQTHLTACGCAMPRRHRAADAAHTCNPCDDVSSALESLNLDTALMDISNTLAPAAPEGGRKHAAVRARRGRPARAAAAASDLEEADCIIRGFADEAAVGTDAAAELEADCMLRAAPRRAAATRASAPRGRKVEPPEAESADTSTEVADTDSECELPPATVTAVRSTRTLRLGRCKGGGSRLDCSTADAQTPMAPARPSGRGCAVVDENAVLATPAQRTTVRRASRFTAMQAPLRAAPLTELPRRSAARAMASTTSARPLLSQPVKNDHQALPQPGGKRGKSRVSSAAQDSPEPALHMSSRLLQTAAREKPTGAGSKKGIRRGASVGVRHSNAAEGEAGRAGKPSCKATPFVIHRAPDLGDAEGDVGELGARMHALALEGDCTGGPSHQSVSGGKATERSPVLLVLDGELQSLPWESLPALQGQG